MELKSRGDAALGWIFGGLFALLFLAVAGHIIVRFASKEPPGIGDVAPSFEMITIDGARVTTPDPERVLLLDFWATTCIGCIGATPKLNRLHERYRERGFSVVGVNLQPEHEEEVRGFAKERELAYPIAIDPGPVAEAYGIWAMPTVVLVGADGKIRAKHRGPVTEELLAKQIEAALRR